MSSEPDRRLGDASMVGQRVAVCLDGSPLGERAVPHAVAIAHALGASVTMLRVLEAAPSGGAPTDPLGWEFQRREARDYTGRMAARYRNESDRVDATVIDGGRAADEICRWTGAHHVDLTAATTHGEGGPSPWAISGTARKLLDRAPGSILMVPASLAEGSSELPRYRRVLVPLDGSQPAEIALPIAERIARAHDAELVLAHVVRDIELTQIGPPDQEDLELVERARRRNERVARLYLERLRTRLSTVPRVAILRGNDIADRLAALVRAEGVDLIVMADGAAPERMDRDGVAVALIARSLTPLLLVRSRPAKSMWRVAQPDRGLIAARLPVSAAS